MATKDNFYIVVDSSYLVSLSHEKDSLYKRAQNIAKSLSGEIILILPAEVFSETINAVAKKIDKKIGIRVAENILSSQFYNFWETNKEIRLEALGKFKTQPNSVSFTDCLVMAFADHFKTKHILGFDEAFSKNGYSLP
mgnify:CR=1 FL=1